MKIQGFWYMMSSRLVNNCQRIARFAASILTVDGETYYCTALKVRAASYSNLSEHFASLHFIILSYNRAAVRTLISQIVVSLCAHVFMLSAFIFRNLVSCLQGDRAAAMPHFMSERDDNLEDENTATVHI
jgi:hypothetical protein